MNKAKFDHHLDQIHRELQALSVSKGREYANSADQLANFKRLGTRLGLIPEVVLLVYLSKHLDAIDFYVRELAGSTHQVMETLGSEPIRGRILDAINYLVLLSALIEEGLEVNALTEEQWTDLQSARKRVKNAIDDFTGERP